MSCDPYDENPPPTIKCLHAKTLPAFDEDKARSMTDAEIRQHYPRFYGKCPDCGTFTISYASYKHYLSGDW